MNPLDVITLTPLMERTSGRREIVIGLLDGPVVVTHPDLVSANLHELSGQQGGASAQASRAACLHGTFVAGILCAQRGSAAPAICPSCTLLVRPIFLETTAASGQMPRATPEALATAIIEIIEAGARVLNLSVALAQPSTQGNRALEEALEYAVSRGVIPVVAAGNQGTLGSTALTRHPWVLAVGACDLQGRPIGTSNLGSSLGRRGLMAPGEAITSLGANGPPLTLGGTSAATPFVTGAIALLWSEFPAATAAEIRYAVTHAAAPRRPTVVPPLLDAWGAYHLMQTSVRR
jgi:subtilisin family serine protease